MNVARSDYRPDVQGLRAVAVLAVLAYHARLPLPGGFVGVDVFFVISGFVITGLLLRQREACGSWAFRTFFARRFRRLYPALALVVVVTVLLSLVIFLPFGRQQTTEVTGLGALFFVSNFVIASTTGGYFDLPASFNPLLNTWSLGVEGQFYLAFPFLIALAWRYGTWSARVRVRTLTVVVVASTVSLGLALASPSIVHSALVEALLGFYGPLGRVWEFGAGALVSLALWRGFRPTGLAATLLSMGGLLGLTASMFVISESDRFPGPWTLLPVASTAVLILGGSNALNVVSRGLSLKPLTVIGDMSYSIYLWHWPFVVFAGSLFPSSRLPLLVATILSLVPAAISYLLVEKPNRRVGNEDPISRRRLVSIVVAPIAVVALALAASNFILRTAVPPVYAGQVLGGPSVANALDSEARKRYPCAFESVVLDDPELFSNSCFQTGKAPATVAVLGDSHAAHLEEGLETVFPDVSFAFVGGHPGKANFWPNAQAIASSQNVSTVIVSAQWIAYDLSDLGKTLRHMEASGKKVFVLDDVPTFSISAETCKFRPLLFLDPRCEDSVPIKRYDAYISDLRTAVSELRNGSLVGSFEHFCNQKSCSMLADRSVLFHDASHLNPDGSEYLISRIYESTPKLVAAIRDNRGGTVDSGGASHLD